MELIDNPSTSPTKKSNEEPPPPPPPPTVSPIDPEIGSLVFDLQEGVSIHVDKINQNSRRIGRDPFDPKLMDVHNPDKTSLVCRLWIGKDIYEFVKTENFINLMVERPEVPILGDEELQKMSLEVHRLTLEFIISELFEPRPIRIMSLSSIQYMYDVCKRYRSSRSVSPPPSKIAGSNRNTPVVMHSGWDDIQESWPVKINYLQRDLEAIELMKSEMFPFYVEDKLVEDGPQSPVYHPSSNVGGKRIFEVRKDPPRNSIQPETIQDIFFIRVPAWFVRMLSIWDMTMNNSLHLALETQFKEGIEAERINITENNISQSEVSNTLKNGPKSLRSLLSNFNHQALTNDFNVLMRDCGMFERCASQHNMQFESPERDQSFLDFCHWYFWNMFAMDWRKIANTQTSVTMDPRHASPFSSTFFDNAVQMFAVIKKSQGHHDNMNTTRNFVNPRVITDFLQAVKISTTPTYQRIFEKASPLNGYDIIKNLPFMSQSKKIRASAPKEVVNTALVESKKANSLEFYQQIKFIDRIIYNLMIAQGWGVFVAQKLDPNTNPYTPMLIKRNRELLKGRIISPHGMVKMDFLRVFLWEMWTPETKLWQETNNLINPPPQHQTTSSTSSSSRRSNTSVIGDRNPYFVHILLQQLGLLIQNAETVRYYAWERRNLRKRMIIARLESFATIEQQQTRPSREQIEEMAETILRENTDREEQTDSADAVTKDLYTIEVEKVLIPLLFLYHQQTGFSLMGMLSFLMMTYSKGVAISLRLDRGHTSNVIESDLYLPVMKFLPSVLTNYLSEYSRLFELQQLAAIYAKNTSTKSKHYKSRSFIPESFVRQSFDNNFSRRWYSNIFNHGLGGRPGEKDASNDGETHPLIVCVETGNYDALVWLLSNWHDVHRFEAIGFDVIKSESQYYTAPPPNLKLVRKSASWKSWYLPFFVLIDTTDYTSFPRGSASCYQRLQTASRLRNESTANMRYRHFVENVLLCCMMCDLIESKQLYDIPVWDYVLNGFFNNPAMEEFKRASSVLFQMFGIPEGSASAVDSNLDVIDITPEYLGSAPLITQLEKTLAANKSIVTQAVHSTRVNTELSASREFVSGIYNPNLVNPSSSAYRPRHANSTYMMGRNTTRTKRPRSDMEGVPRNIAPVVPQIPQLLTPQNLSNAFVPTTGIKPTSSDASARRSVVIISNNQIFSPSQTPVLSPIGTGHAASTTTTTTTMMDTSYSQPVVVTTTTTVEISDTPQQQQQQRQPHLNQTPIHSVNYNSAMPYYPPIQISSSNTFSNVHPDYDIQGFDPTLFFNNQEINQVRSQSQSRPQPPAGVSNVTFEELVEALSTDAQIPASFFEKLDTDKDDSPMVDEEQMLQQEYDALFYQNYVQNEQEEESEYPEDQQMLLDLLNAGLPFVGDSTSSGETKDKQKGPHPEELQSSPRERSNTGGREDDDDDFMDSLLL